MPREVYAYAIGINKYEHHRDLSCCEKDANSFLLALRQRAPQMRSELLCANGRSGAPPDENAIRSLLKRVSDTKAGEQDMVCLFFAGHGASQSGRDYLLASDTKDITDSTICTDDIIAALNQSGAGTVVLIADACRVEAARAPSLFGERTAELARRKGVIVFFGCSPGEVCQELDSPGCGNGIFTLAFTTALGESPTATPLELDRRLQQLVTDLCVKNKLKSQRPYTVVAPIQKAVEDLYTGRALGIKSTRKHCILIAGPSNAGKTSIGQMLASDLGYVHIEMSSFAWQRFQKFPAFPGSMQDFMEDVVWHKNEMDIIAKDLISEHGEIDKFVICGPRRPEEIETLWAQGWEVSAIYLYANALVRFQRHQLTYGHKTRYEINYPDFVVRDMREYGWGLAKAATMSGFKLVINEAGLDSAYAQVRAHLLKHH